VVKKGFSLSQWQMNSKINRPNENIALVVFIGFFDGGRARRT
jgi:hypothetical protein